MDLEFFLLNTLARALPPIPGCGRIANGLRAVYARKPRALMTAKRDGLRLHLDPSECVDGSYLELAKSCGYRHIHTWSGINAVLELGT